MRKHQKQSKQFYFCHVLWGLGSETVCHYYISLNTNLCERLSVFHKVLKPTLSPALLDRLTYSTGAREWHSEAEPVLWGQRFENILLFVRTMRPTAREWGMGMGKPKRPGFTELGLALQYEVWPHIIKPTSKNEIRSKIIKSCLTEWDCPHRIRPSSQNEAVLTEWGLPHSKKARLTSRAWSHF